MRQIINFNVFIRIVFYHHSPTETIKLTANFNTREMRELVVNNIKMTIINIFYVINKIEKNISMTT